MTPLVLRPRQPAGRRLSELLDAPEGAALELVRGDAGVLLSGATLDSRSVQPGDLYAALPGAKVHGARFVDEVTAAGAVAILTDQDGARLVEASLAEPAVALLTCSDPRAAVGGVAAWVHGYPSRRLALLGVTGTNGKTTVAYLLDGALRAAGHVTGLIGTVETRVAGESVASVRTTPEAPALQAMLAMMLEQGVTAVSMEVSSHALALGRVAGCDFAGALFTNLSQDHLDFHPTMTDYFEAKALLFEPARSAVAVVNTGDAAGRRLAERRPGCVTYAVEGAGTAAAAGEQADWSARAVRSSGGGSTFHLRGPGVDRPLSIALPGAFNVANALGAVALLAALGMPVDAVCAGIAAVEGVPGRMQRVDRGQPFLALVDYAHTPDAVERVLAAVRAAVPGPVVAVLGCGGDRDRGKRPLMGAALARGADVAVLTSDNPRSEDPGAILAAMLDGARAAGGHAELLVEPDRAAAIALAVGRCAPGGAVVVAGKGHETGQDVCGLVTPFDDRVVLGRVLDQGAYAGGPR